MKTRPIHCPAFISAIILVLVPPGLRAATTIHPTNAYAWGANIGWINARGDVVSGGATGEFICRGWIYSANVGWISLGGGSPANGIRYQNNSATDFGVNVQDYSAGGGTVEAKLRGYAYSGNVGWIAFETIGDSRVDRATGQLRGHAYSANTGWIVLSGSGVTVQTTSIAAGTDSDSDTIADAWERSYAGNLTLLTKLTDYDGDGIPDRNEYAADTNPLNSGDAQRITAFTAPRRLVPGGEFMTDLTWTTKPTRWYAIDLNSGLLNPWTTQVNTILPGPGATTGLSFSEGGPAARHFYRVRARMPLSP